MPYIAPKRDCRDWSALFFAFVDFVLQTSIGKWKGIQRLPDASTTANANGGDGTDSFLLTGDVLVFEKGQKCWKGPSRSLRVALACGPEDVLSTVAEPETCTYTAVLETPAACLPGLKDLLFAGAFGGGVEFRESSVGAGDEL